ncbi:MAG: phage tail tape measure protein [Nitratireductor sp.]|uniref:phage tail tape measure protein n=1 Tax=Nitratireductor sp. TaxID=1872084 RepID=UPI00260F80BC|nr:phage tail tape measure protein [Nitratireductor sp.]MCV0350189.1 phage tail tape measure protein [Nitratireductor sp.]
MALENNDIRYDVDIDLRDSLREIDVLQKRLKGFGDNLEVDAARVQQEMRKAAKSYVDYIRRLESELKSLRAQGKDTSSHEARLSQMRGRQRSASSAAARDWGQGSDGSRASRAVLERELNEMRSTSKQLMGRYFDELNGMHLREVKRSLTDLRAEETLLRSRMQDRADRARMGDAAYGFAKQRERRTLNGGANQLTSQAGIMSNYMMVGGMYSAGFYLGNFIAQLDKEFKQFQAITATTNTEMSIMEDRLISVSEKTKFTALQVSEAATLMGQAGMSAAEVGQAIEPITMLATAAGTDLKEAVDVVTSALNIFNLQASEAGHLSDVFTAALNESKLTLNQLTLALQYAGNIAATAGVSYNELTAAVGALANAGIRSGSTMGTGLRQMLVDLISPSKNLRAEMDRLGLSMADIDIETNGLTGVMVNLRAAGFDTASAFEGLEVRAAAAYTALSNNIDTMANLRQAFILSNAATKANETQMQSLTNTAAKFGSALGSVTYEAFRPFLGVLQEFVNMSADVLTVLRNWDYVDELGVVISGLVAGAIIAKLGRLAAGLLGIGTAAKTAAAGVTILNGALRVNPVVLGLATLTAGITALRHYGDAANRTAAQLDQLEAAQNSYQAQVDRTVNRISSLDEAIVDLLRKQRTLEASGNDILRQTKIMEVISSFEELAGTVDASSSSVGELVEAMRDLRTEMAAGLPETFDLLVTQIDERIRVLRETIDTQARGDGMTTAMIAASGRFGNGGAMYFDQLPMFNEQVEQLFGSRVATAYKATTDQIDPTEIDGQLAQAIQSRIEKMIIDLEGKIRPLEDQAGFLGMGLDEDQNAELTQLTQDLNFLKGMSQAFKPIAQNLISLAATEKEREIKVNDQLLSKLGSTSAYQNAKTLSQEADGFLKKRLADITREGPGIEEEVKLFAELEAEMAKRIAKIRAEMEAAAEHLRNTTNFTEEEISRALRSSDLNTDIAGLQNSLNKDSAGADENAKNLRIYFREKEKKRVSRRLEATKSQLRDAQNDHEINLLENQLYSLHDQLILLETELFELDKDDALGNDEAALELARRKLKDEQKGRHDGLVGTVIEQRQKLGKEVNKLHKEDLEEKLAETNKKMKELAQSIDNDSTVELIRTIKEELDRLNGEAKRLAGEIAGISVSGDYGTFTTGGLPSADANEIQSKIIRQANARGIPPHIALAIASFESGFRPNAENPHSSAYGIYQNTDGNWKSHGYGPQDRSNIDAQIAAGIEDMHRTQKALGSTQLSFQDYYGSHLLGQAGYKRVRANPNGNAVDVLGADVVSGNGGHAGQTAAEFAAMVTAKAAAHLEKTKHLIQRPMDAAANAFDEESERLTKGARDAVKDAGERIAKNQTTKAVKLLDDQAKAVEAQINTLMVQSAKVTNPEALQSIIDQIRSKWGEMMEKELEAFRVENEGTDGFEGRLQNLNDQLEAGLSSKIVTLLDRYQNSIENLEYAPLENAKAELAAAQNPAYAHKYSEGEIFNLENNVRLQERNALMERHNQLGQLLTYITQEIANAESQYGANSQQVQLLKERQYSIEQSLGRSRTQLTAETKAAARGEMDLKTAIEQANRAWMQRNGLMDSNGRLISAAEQAGQAWGQVLDTLTQGFSQLFMDLASGTMDAEEAFKKFALSVIQMLMQMIAKQLAFNAVQALMGGGGGGGFLGMLIGGGMATGGYMAGVKRAATGEYISGNAPFRDSQLRAVMPGEMVLRASAVNQIGRDALERVNALGNRKVAAGLPQLPTPERGDSRPINIWAVLPEEQQQIGPDDVVAFISQDIRNRGVTRKLIKAVNTGKL